MNNIEKDDLERRIMILKALKGALSNMMLEDDCSLNIELTNENIEKIYQKIFLKKEVGEYHG